MKMFDGKPFAAETLTEVNRLCMEGYCLIIEPEDGGGSTFLHGTNNRVMVDRSLANFAKVDLKRVNEDDFKKLYGFDLGSGREAYS